MRAPGTFSHFNSFFGWTADPVTESHYAFLHKQVNYSVTMGVYEWHTDTFKVYHLYFLRQLKHANLFFLVIC